MYGIFTKAGALLIKFNAATFDAAFGIMDAILARHPNVDENTVFLCETT